MLKYFILVVPIIFGVGQAWGDVLIQNDQQYIGDDGSFHIVGEIQNNLDIPLNQVDVYATVYSANNEELDTVRASSLLYTIMPGMRGPFDLVINPHTSELPFNYLLELDYKVSDPKEQVIEVTSSELTRDTLGNLLIEGTVANRGDITANTVVIIATLYDRNGKVVAVTKNQPEPDYLRAHGQTYFMIAIPDKLQTQRVVDYTVVAESEEYTAVPEFPVGSGILLASSVFGYVLLTRYSNRFIANLAFASDSR